ncbi:MAG: GPR endopeptidase [Clostridiales bacterium]|jgi:spore protease|nr:GPR endopeptidase [Clostridiales bacterium]
MRQGYLRTDLAAELIKPKTKKIDEYITRTDVVLDAKAAARYHKPEGVYTTIESDVVLKGDTDGYKRLTEALRDALREFTGMSDNCLVVGLGNPNMTADALGSGVSKRIAVTRNLPTEAGEDGARPKGISTICPNVLGVTGIESFDIVKGVVERVKPALVLVVDSLCAAATERIAAAFQICSAGITPGSGVSNFRFRLDEQSLGVKVVSLGVPLVVYAATIVREAAGASDINEKFAKMIVTPKDIDLIVEDCAEIIAGAINGALKSRVHTT